MGTLTPIFRSLPLVCIISFWPSIAAWSQIQWQKEPNPVINPSVGSFDDDFAFDPCVTAEKDILRMWYVGMRGSYIFSIGEALSPAPDGIHWYGYRNNPTFSPGSGYDASGVRGPSIVKDDQGYKMYYFTGPGNQFTIGLATSSDGYTWVRYSGNPVLTPGASGSWDQVGVWAPSVIYENNVYKMWYTGIGSFFSSVGYATSIDGLTWQKHAGNPVVVTGNSREFDYRTVGEASVIRQNGFYHMFYTGADGSSPNKIGYARSTDGLIWVKNGSPVLLNGPSSWDVTHVGGCSVIYWGNRFHMWYSGYGGSSGWQIGYATSLDQGLREDRDAIELIGNFPNPFNPSTRIEFFVPEKGKVRLVVFDMLGREVSSEERFFDQGRQEFSWNGRTNRGLPVSSGAYIAKLVFEGQSGKSTVVLHKMTYLR